MNKFIKRTMRVITTGLLMFSLVACGQNKPENNTQGKAEQGEKKEITIGMAFPAADHGWLGAIITNAEEEAKAQGVKYIMTTADNPSKQTSNVEDLITRKVDAIVMLPIETDPMTPVAAKVQEAGIPLIIVDRELNTDKFTALIKGDNKGIGTNAAKYIAKELQGKGNVVEIAGNPSSVTTLRSEGFKDELKNYPDIKVIASQAGDFQKEKSLNVMQNILQTNPQIDAVYTQDDEMALGVLQAIKEAKRTDIKVVTGAGGCKDVYKLIKDGDSMMKATFIYSPLMVKDAVKTAVNKVKGNEPSSKTIVIPADQVDKTNVEKLYDPNSLY